MSRLACFTGAAALIGLAIVGCGSHSDAPADGTGGDPPASFTRTIVQRHDDGTETVTAYRVTPGAESDTVTMIGRVGTTADGTHTVTPLNCPSCNQGNGSCADADLRIWDNTGVACGPTGCFRGAAYTGNEMCFTGGGTPYSFGSYCRVWSSLFGCLDTWADDVDSFQTGGWNACFRIRWDVGYSYAPWLRVPSTAGSALSMFETKHAYGVELTSYADPGCTP
jgi:hypothetical protein